MLLRSAYTPCPQPEPRSREIAPSERGLGLHPRGQQLLTEMEAYARRNPPCTLARIAREAVNNSRLPDALRNGLNPRDITCQRVRCWMEANER